VEKMCRTVRIFVFLEVVDQRFGRGKSWQGHQRKGMLDFINITKPDDWRLTRRH
jgi:hypothetical protein